jgi:hypothetical protein
LPMAFSNPASRLILIMGSNFILLLDFQDGISPLRKEGLSKIAFTLIQSQN